MAKGKSLNPADAQRKAERKKELKKNKAERQKARDFSLVKKDTTELEEKILRLEKAETDETITPAQRTQLPALRAELKRINKKKDDYVAEHPEHRKLVFRHHTKTEETQGVENEGKNKERKVFDKNGLPRHPERSIYYDSVMNPFGVPPPGMPYMERPLRADETDSQAEDDSGEGESDDDITMPSGPPPMSKDAQPDSDDDGAGAEDSDDDIPMPTGPPPSQVHPPLPSMPLPRSIFPLPYLNPPLPFVPNSHQPPRLPGSPPVGFGLHASSGLPHPSVPPPPPLFSAVPPPPPLPGNLSHYAGQASLPPRSRVQSDASMQDPLSSSPHQTFQSYHANQGSLTHPLPEKPNVTSTVPGQPEATSSGSTISAPAQLRDLKKESTAFMPSSLKRKKPGGATRSSGQRVNAAPAANNAGEVEGVSVRPDLLSTLQSNFPAPPGYKKNDPEEATGKKRKLDLPAANRGKDDYEMFMQEIGDIL